MEAGIFPKRDCIAVPTITFRAKPSEVLVPLATSPSTTSTPLRMRRWSLMAGLFVHRWPTSCQGANGEPITSKNSPPPTWDGRILKVPPKLAAGSRQNSQAGGLRYVAQPSRLRVRGASEPHVPSHRRPTDGGTIKTRPSEVWLLLNHCKSSARR